jgi:glycosyltransferase involved in cell wall biosynthesis
VNLAELRPNTSRREEGGLRRKGYYKKPTRQKPLISVVQPVLNMTHGLERSIQSVVTQSYSNVEYLIIDGGSNDETLEILREKESDIDYWVSESDKGIYDAMNKGISLAHGDWIYFLGADDILVNCLHHVVPHLTNPRHVYYGDVYLPGKNKVYSGRFNVHTLISKNINHQSIFYPRRVFERYRYNLNYKILADYELNIRCWGEGHFRFKYLPVLVCVHHDDGCSFHKHDVAFHKDKPDLIGQYFSRQILLRSMHLKTRGAFAGLLQALGVKQPLSQAIRWARRRL